MPPSGAGPGVVVIQEWWGLVPHIEDVCDRFAAAGFVALAPDLYRGTKVTEPDEAGKEMMALQLDRAAQDMSGAVDEVVRRSSGDKVGVVGFCMGGGLALVLATQRPDAVAACVSFYGLIPWPDAQPDFSKLSAAVLAHVAGDDEYFSPQAAARARGAAATSLGKEAEFHVYDGADHAFFNDTRPEVYDAGGVGDGVDTHDRLLPRPPRVTPGADDAGGAVGRYLQLGLGIGPPHRRIGRRLLRPSRAGRACRLGATARPAPAGRRRPCPDRRRWTAGRPSDGDIGTDSAPEPGTRRRRRWLRAQTVGLLTTARRLAGEPIGYEEEVESVLRGAPPTGPRRGAGRRPPATRRGAPGFGARR